MKKIAGKPIGIWIAWGSLAYTFVGLLRELACGGGRCPVSRIICSSFVVPWVVWAVAVASLYSRRLVAWVFVSMSMSLLLHSSVKGHDPLGAAVAILGVASVFFCRRWFDEYVPK